MRETWSAASQIVMAAKAPIHECLVPGDLFDGRGSLIGRHGGIRRHDGGQDPGLGHPVSQCDPGIESNSSGGVSYTGSRGGGLAGRWIEWTDPIQNAYPGFYRHIGDFQNW